MQVGPRPVVLAVAIAVIPASGGRIENISAAFDEDPSIVRWTPAGIFFAASQHTWSFLYSIDPATRAVKQYSPSDRWIGSSFSLTPDGQTVAYIAADASTLGEVYVSPVAPLGADARSAKAPRKLTDMSAQVARWAKSALEVVSWKSQDGATIEGVLHKPIGFQAGKKYPLLVVIHGGIARQARRAAIAAFNSDPVVRVMRPLLPNT